MENINKYTVLARKYRPAVFDDLIGQEALVRTLSNAIASGRLAQAYMLTGIRGVGKTTSARIIAKALNCVGADGNGGMTPNPCGVCENCRAITEDRHIDVQEIDAASNTQVANVREIIENAKYNPVSARFKIYIIDEVHMLSNSAFAALLKLLEEPPERVKFIFATTEIRKVPITILSRCQRFDLRRVEESLLVSHFKSIIGKEGIEASDAALRIIASVADGSVRDGLSLLDRAIAHSGTKIDEDMVRAMLGQADRAVIFAIFESLMKGDIKSVLAMMQEQYNAGANALTVLQDLQELVFWITKLKISPEIADDVTVPEVDRVKGKELAEKLSMPVLTRVWQMLLKGVAEVSGASSPLSAAEMALIRIAYAAELPSPSDVVKELKKKLAEGARGKIVCNPEAKILAEPKESSSEPVASVRKIATLKDIAELARKKGEFTLAVNIEAYLHFVSLENKVLKVRPEDGAPRDIAFNLASKMQDWTGERWQIILVEEEGAETIKQKEQREDKLLKDSLAKNPLVEVTLNTFPNAKMVDAIPLFEDDANTDDDNNDNFDEGE